MKALGKHILAEFYDCKAEILNDVKKIEEIMVEAANVIKACVVNQSFHKFEPHGVSGVVVIAESHLSIHTWPEYNFASVDVYTCGDKIDPWIAYEYLNEVLKAKRSNVLEVKRGIITSENTTIKYKPGEN
ncbi:S-adenosylmethionine decarboxylase proenzyme [bacterium]|nr:S-adenosylmethionine decarboxylase proenzyme [bacterium]